MQHVTVFGNNYYVIDGVMPDAAQYRINGFTNRYGNNLDLAPNWVRHKANFVLRKWGST